MMKLQQLLLQELDPLEVREAYRSWLKAPNSLARRNRAFHATLPLVHKATRRFRLRGDDKDDLIQELSMRLFQLLFEYLPSSPRLDALVAGNGSLAAYVDRALAVAATDWFSRFTKQNQESFDFDWACIPPPHHRTEHPQDVLPKLLREQVAEYVREYVLEKNRLGGTLGEVVELMLHYDDLGMEFPQYQMRYRGLRANQIRFVQDYVTIQKRLGLEDLREKGGV
jgi:DNA-directed RNA polymerase specialized sigma24 family protein